MYINKAPPPIFKHPNILDTVPKPEVHGLYLVTNSLIQNYQVIEEIKIPVTKVYIAKDTISTILALNKSPMPFPTPFCKYYSDINTHLFILANKTGQLKQELVFFINQGVNPNPVDFFNKF